MFGYITPLTCELKVRDHNLYKSIYCGLCRNLKKNYGHLFSLFLSYDLVFFVMFAVNFSNDKLNFENKFCPAHPLKKKLCLKSCKALDIACDLTVLLTYYKLQDKLNDETLLKKIAAKLLLILIKRSFKKASRKQPYLLNLIKKFVQNQAEIENKTNTPSLDSACHPTADFLGELFKIFSSKIQTQNDLYYFGYMLGRFIYLTDALDDIYHDIKLNNFNPFLKSTNLINKQKVELTEQCNEIFRQAFFTINFTLANLIKSYKKIEIQSLNQILSNIVFMGLAYSLKKIFKKHNQIKVFEENANMSTSGHQT